MIKYCICEDEDALEMMKKYILRSSGHIIDDNDPNPEQVNYTFDFRNLYRSRLKLTKTDDIICFILNREMEEFKKYVNYYLRRLNYIEHSWMNPTKIYKQEDVLCENSSKDLEISIFLMRLDPLRMT